MLLVERDVLSDDGFAKTWKPYEEPRFPVLVTSAYVDTWFAAWSEFPLFLEGLILEEDMALGAKNFEVFVGRGEVGIEYVKRDLEIIAGTRSTCSTFNVKANASTAETFAHIGEVQVMANGGKKLPAAIIFGKCILVLAPRDAEALSNVHIHEEIFERGRGALVIAVEYLYALGKAMVMEVGIEHLSVDTFFLGTAKGAS